MKQYLKKLLGITKTANFLREELEKVKVLSSQPMVNYIKGNAGAFKSIQEAEFSAFSQWGDDGIIQYLINTLDIKNQTFIEFGVQNYLEANTRFLLINNNWKGLIIDGSEKNINYIKTDSISWKYSITSIAQFITKDNLNTLIKNAGFEGEIGILHIDVDGNDYWFWENLNVVNPEIVIMEYNSLFGSKATISVPYKDDFFVTNEHYSNLYFGTSLNALNHLAEQKGYTLVGSNSHGNNAYFVRNDKLKSINPCTVEEAYVKCNFRQNRNQNGQLTLVDDIIMIKNCKDLPVVNVVTSEVQKLEFYL
ncbi:MAG: hypothetical protein V4643_08750 [Bacteroidota bacterium]